MNVGHVLVAGQRVANQHCIGTRRIERAVGLIGNLKGREFDSRVKLQRFVGTEARDMRMRMLRLAQAVAQVVGFELHVGHAPETSLPWHPLVRVAPLRWPATGPDGICGSPASTNWCCSAYCPNSGKSNMPTAGVR
jgi:hypothetical protein